MNSTAFNLALVCMAVLFALAIAAGVSEEARWTEFSRQHDCKVVGKKAAQVLQGPQTVIAPERTVYLCDDGVTYER